MADESGLGTGRYIRELDMNGCFVLFLFHCNRDIIIFVFYGDYFVIHEIDDGLGSFIVRIHHSYYSPFAILPRRNSQRGQTILAIALGTARDDGAANPDPSGSARMFFRTADCQYIMDRLVLTPPRCQSEWKKRSSPTLRVPYLRHHFIRSALNYYLFSKVLRFSQRQQLGVSLDTKRFCLLSDNNR